MLFREEVDVGISIGCSSVEWSLDGDCSGRIDTGIVWSEDEIVSSSGIGDGSEDDGEDAAEPELSEEELRAFEEDEDGDPDETI